MPLPSYNANAILTKTRRAVWDAIDNWQPLRDWEANCVTQLWKQRLEGDLNEILSADSTFAELPSITYRPADVSESWETNRMARFSDKLLIDIRTQYLDQAEELAEMVWQAIWQSAPADAPSVSYIRLGTGRLPQSVAVQRQMGIVGNQKAWVFTLSILLEPNQDLYSTVLQARVST